MIRTRHVVAPLVAALLVAGCSGAQSNYGRVAVQASALTRLGGITSVVVTSGNVTAGLTFDSSSQHFTGSLALPVGDQTLTVQMFAQDQLVGSGSANVTIVAGKTAAVSVRVLDATGSQAQLDAGPYIISLSTPSTSTVLGQPLTLTAKAVDANGDAIAYAWTSTCGGSFSAQAATTAWTPDMLGSCKLTLTTTSKSLQDSESVNVFVFSAASTTGAATIDAEYVAGPEVFGVQLMDYTTANNCSVYTYNTDSMCRYAYKVTDSLWLNVVYSAGPNPTVSRSDNCGGSFDQWGDWLPPAAGGLCTLTGTVTNADGISNSYSLSAYITP